VREKLQANLLHLLPIQLSNQPTDVFTKALNRENFQLIVSKLGMMNIHHPA